MRSQVVSLKSRKANLVPTVRVVQISPVSHSQVLHRRVIAVKNNLPNVPVCTYDNTEDVTSDSPIVTNSENWVHMPKKIITAPKSLLKVGNINKRSLE